MVTMAAAKQICSYVGGTLFRYKALADTKSFHRSQSKIRWVLGGNRSGKSEANIGADLSSFALGIHPYKETPKRNITIWVGAETWQAVGKILWAEKLERYLPKSRIVNIRWHNSGDKIPKEVVLLRDGEFTSTIEFKAFEQGRKAFEGRGIDAFYGDEQCKNQSQGIWHEIQARLMDHSGFVSWSMTPVLYQHWFSTRVLSLPNTDEVFYVDLENNRKSRGGYIEDREIDTLIAEWPEEVQETRIKGHLAAFFGAVYRTYNRSVHEIEPFEIPRHWRKIRAIDFGFSNPFVCLWVAIDEDGRYYVYREHYKAQAGMEDHATHIKRHSAGEKYLLTCSDHDAQDNFELAKYGVMTQNANKNVHAGIEDVQRCLKVQGDNKPRLFVFNTCKNLIKEFPGYKYPEGTNTKNPQDVPIGKDDHALDALRYAIHSHLDPNPGTVKAEILGQLY